MRWVPKSSIYKLNRELFTLSISLQQTGQCTKLIRTGQDSGMRQNQSDFVFGTGFF